MASKHTKPLPLSATLRDLAVLRASGLDLSSLIPASAEKPESEADVSVERSTAFIQTARSAIKVQDMGSVDAAGRKLESLRGVIDEVSHGVDVSKRFDTRRYTDRIMNE
ncbi:hypothetical protein BDZ89DRAFT_413135 [Hymenopellis radicata]|nr:hypothetical protein BDZ89DRAFT_413135 [Hymenopellis radicata]